MPPWPPPLWSRIWVCRRIGLNLFFDSERHPQGTRPAGHIQLDFPIKPERKRNRLRGWWRPWPCAQVRRQEPVRLLGGSRIRSRGPSLGPGLQAIVQGGLPGLIVTARSADARFDFVSRFFAPAAGVDEDPVTGSAHCCLADFGRNAGQGPFVAFQASARGGVVHVEVQQDRVLLGGQAVIVAQGELLLA